ncbi:MAG: LysR family transcriptional regulator [Clostridiales bacterium]|nr:LysR family transcriptional regulator [Clostridiales bacterium]MBS5878317.1 LysR family transcriptional regulator [Clostridiales bacterium]MDU0939699.1 LysR family transcriptional regulator [Clostridiales bacterium]MDU1042615.1 LysR family transcriptional regulator [Clostridiales bacterium]MDU3490343.1 LysR family transcriptional regulator [Clostridiales bacterium]
MDIKQIQAFISVVDTGSFNSAAKVLYTSVSQVSKQVKSLEEEVSCKLLERKKTGVTLTEEGVIFQG